MAHRLILGGNPNPNPNPNSKPDPNPVAHLVLGGDVDEELLHVPVEDAAQVGLDAQRQDCLVVTRACDDTKPGSGRTARPKRGRLADRGCPELRAASGMALTGASGAPAGRSPCRLLALRRPERPRAGGRAAIGLLSCGAVSRPPSRSASRAVDLPQHDLL